MRTASYGLRLPSYGADQYFKVTSDKGNIAGQVGFNTDGTSVNTGVDVAGTINGHVATRCW